VSRLRNLFERQQEKSRICTKCGLEKSIEEFPFKSTSRGIRHSVCKDCTNIRSSVRYYNDPQQHIQRVNQSRGDYLQNNAQYVFDYLSEHPCIECGETSPTLLEFDHRPGTNKIERISQMVTSGYSLEKIITEISKCDVRCVNCHRRKTSQERGWFKSSPSSQSKDSREAQRERSRKFVYDYLSSHPCVECGASDPVILEFHHLGDKTNTIAKMATSGFGVDSIQAEIDQCIVLCASCHRKVTAKERGWWRSRR
jgi:hypothetical protein